MPMALSEQLSSLVSRNLLRAYVAAPDEVRQHIDTAGKHLTDARRKENSLETRFSVANTAGHMLLMAAIKMKGYRTSSEKGHRVILYQILDDLLPGAANSKITLAKAHNARNRAEYDGDDLDVTQGQVDDVIDAVQNVKEEVDYLYKKYKREFDVKAKAAAT